MIDAARSVRLHRGMRASLAIERVRADGCTALLRLERIPHRHWIYSPDALDVRAMVITGHAGLEIVDTEVRGASTSSGDRLTGDVDIALSIEGSADLIVVTVRLQLCSIEYCGLPLTVRLGTRARPVDDGGED